MAEENDIPCKEPGCDNKIPRDRVVVHAVRSDTKRSKRVSIYLTCEEGHTHKYIVDRYHD